jgi:hypothetical protein
MCFGPFGPSGQIVMCSAVDAARAARNRFI